MEKLPRRVVGLIHKMLGMNLPLEHILFLCGAAAGIALSAFGAIGNLSLGFHFLSVLVPLLNLIVDICCVVYSIVTKRWRGPAIVLFFFASFILFPFLWFTTGGTMSSSLPLIIGLGVVLIIVFSGKLRAAFFAATLVLYSTFILVELNYPNIFIPYPNRETWYWDVLFGFALSYVASGGIAYFTLQRYNAAKREAEMLVKQLDTISKTDALTGVFNRRHLMGQLDEEMRSAFDNGSALSLCIFDIDHFKQVNDNYGHLYGDEVLVKIARTIASCLGENEIFGRYGGEEFIVVFQNSNLAATIRTVDKIYAALKEIEWSHGGSITISGGISVYEKGLSYSKFLGNADANLYKAKSNGRNRVEY